MSRHERLRQLEKKKKELMVKINRIERKMKRKTPKTHRLNPPFICVKDVGFSETKGPRPTMEDGHCLIDRFRGNDYEAFFGVYDGHSGNDPEGRTTVDYVEDHLHKNFVESLRECKSVFKAFIRSFKKTDHGLRIYNAFGNGSTVVCAYLTQIEDVKVHPDRKQKVLYVANAGDSRAVLSRGGKAVRLTVDHKASKESEKDRIEAAGGGVKKGRVMGAIAVSRSLGDHACKNWVVSDPHCTEVKLTREDDILILACDGVWDVIDDQDAIDICRKARLEDGMNCMEISKLLVDRSLEEGSDDNISVIVIFLKTDD